MAFSTKSEAIDYLQAYLETPLPGSLDTEKLKSSIDALAMCALENSLPNGVIVAQRSTATRVPDGWALCDGTNGTPNLTGVTAGVRYVVKINPVSLPS